MTDKPDQHVLDWPRVIALALIHGYQHIILSSIAPILPLIQAEFSLSYSQLGLLTSMPRLSGGILQLPAGMLADRLGKVRVLLWGFAVLLSSIYFSGLAPTFGLLLFLQLTNGMGDSAFHPTTYALISQGAPREKLGRSMSIHTVGGFAGTALGVVLVAWLGDRLGWRNTLLTVAVPGVVLLVLMRIWFREPPGRDPADCAASASNGSIFGGTVLAMVFGVALMNGVVMQGLLSFLPTFLGAVYDMSLTAAGAYSFIMMTCGVISIAVGGWLADRLDRYNILLAGAVATFFTVTLLSLWSPPVALLAVLLGATGVAIYITTPAYTALISTFTSADAQGSLYGLSFAGGAMGGFLGSLLVGYLADGLGLRMAFMALATAALVRAAMLGALKMREAGARHPAVGA